MDGISSVSADVVTQSIEAVNQILKVAQAESIEIAQKMIKMCEKYWSKGEHRCYCQKYIEYAPDDIQKNSTCK